MWASSNRSWHSWYDMKYRCNVLSCPSYKDYGGRGITYHPDWEYFENFLQDMGERPEGFTLERLDNSLGYYKENCKWATRKEQQQNKRPYKLRVDSPFGIRGVNWVERDKRFYAGLRRQGVKTIFYSGRDFFEACCAIKSWESKNVDPDLPC